MTTTTLTARAIVNHGRWIAECPDPNCYNAMALEPKEATFHCGGLGGCRLIAPLEWPANADEIWEALAERPDPRTRNWAPTGHRQAIVDGLPEGQSVNELRSETAERMQDGGA